MNKFTLGFVRKVEVSLNVTIINNSFKLDIDDIISGLTYGDYEVSVERNVIIDSFGDVIATFCEYKEEDETISKFENLD